MAGLFKKKKKEKKKKNQDTKDIRSITEDTDIVSAESEGLSETIIGEGDIQSILGDVLKGTGIDDISEKLDDITRKLDEFQAKLERHDSLISSLQNEMNEIRKVNEEIQDNIKRLLDIYEVVSQKINPFIDMNDKSERLPPEVESIIPVENQPQTPSEPAVYEETSIENMKAAPQKTIQEHISEREQEHTKSARPSGTPILKHIKKDYYTIVLLMRWIEFLFERVKRDKITLLLDYYVDIGWISKEVKSEIMAYARGEVQDVTAYFPEEEIEAEIETPGGTIKAPNPKLYKKVDDWRLSAEDHLKSLLFIMKIAGMDVNKDRLNSLEQEIEKFKKSLWEYHGV